MCKLAVVDVLIIFQNGNSENAGPWFVAWLFSVVACVALVCAWAHIVVCMDVHCVVHG